MEGADAVICGFETRTQKVPLVCTLYDLIPLVMQDIYLRDEATRERYLRRLRIYNRADLVLTISEHTGLDATRLLRIPRDKIVNVSAAASPVFRKLESCDASICKQISEFGITSNFVLYTGGFDPRKNLQGMITAFGELPSNIRGKYQMVIVCSLLPGEVDHLTAWAAKHGVRDSLILTNFVSEEVLVHLYNLCDVFVFPSLYEGFGLPVLEAMSCGAPVVVSNTSSLPEITASAGILVDPGDPKATANAIASVLESRDLNRELRCRALERAKLFSWKATGSFSSRA